MLNCKHIDNDVNFTLKGICICMHCVLTWNTLIIVDFSIEGKRVRLVRSKVRRNPRKALYRCGTWGNAVP